MVLDGLAFGLESSYNLYPIIIGKWRSGGLPGKAALTFCKRRVYNKVISNSQAVRQARRRWRVPLPSALKIPQKDQSFKMDFVDLDRVLDEFEEEEKQGYVPGCELKPSGYIEFLEKHQEKDWERINSSGTFSSTSGYTLERKAQKEPVSVSYDEPYNSSSSNKLSFFADATNDGLKLSHQSEIVTSLTRVTTNGDHIGTVYTSINGYDRKGIANKSERKGTIACQATEVQTDALSPASEEELMSSPFPKTDIIVDGHGDTSVSNSESATDNNGDQNHSPIYASMDHEIIMSTGGQSSHDGSTLKDFVSENQSSASDQFGIQKKSNYSSLVSDSSISEHVISSVGVVGFDDTAGEDPDENEVNIYLEEFVEAAEMNSDLSSVNHSTSGQSANSIVSDSVPEFQHYLNADKNVKSLAEELTAAQPKLTDAFQELNESLPKKFCPDKSAERQLKYTSHDPDLVVNLAANIQSTNVSQDSEFNEVTRQGHEVSNTSAIVMSNNVETESNLETKGQEGLQNIVSNFCRSNAFNSIMEGRMEIETLLDDKNQQQQSVNIALGEKLLKGKMEIEDILDEAIYNQKNDVQVSDQTLGCALISGHGHPDVTLGSTNDKAPNEQSGHSLSPGYSSAGQKEPGSPMLGVGARPKDPSAIKKNRPNSLLGLSKVNLDFPTVVKEVNDIDSNEASQQADTQSLPGVAQPSENYKQLQSASVEPQLADEAKQRMNAESSQPYEEQGFKAPVIHDFTRQSSAGNPHEDSLQQPQDPYASSPPENSSPGNQSGVSKMKRPTSLNLPHRPGFDVSVPEEDRDETANDQSSISSNGIELNPEEEAGAIAQSQDIAQAYSPESLGLGHSSLGYEPPFWIPDSEAPSCMMCQAKFTMWKRRHHCRACGKVLCSTCCSQRALLPYLDNKEARVCLECHTVLVCELRAGPGSNSPNPNNPTEYCSKVPPSQQASGNANPPVVMVPTGVLKTSGSQRKPGEAKQVMFSDGIRPGGDLTELDGPDQTRRRRSARTGRKSGTASTQPQRSEPAPPKTKEESLLRSPCLVPEAGLPPLYIMTGDNGVVETDPVLNELDYTSDYKNYPCPLVSVCNRKPVFFEIGHTIINLLADFRNYQYMLIQIRGATIHMENKKTVISFPRNRYNDVMKVVRNSNEHVMALGSSFSTQADSHLVCIQGEDGNYQTQAINIQNKPRLVTGASFVVFNGALKASTGLRAKSSIVEDGLMIQVLPETLASLKQALVDMTGFTIQCGPADTEVPEESVEIRWVDNDKGFNLGVKSYLDDTSLEGMESVSVKCPMDILGSGEGNEGLAIRWTRVYFLQHDESNTSHFDPLDLSRLTEDVAQACCTALAKHLGQLKQESQIRLGLRVNLTSDAVGYEIGSKGKPLPPVMVSDLDTFLVPIVHQASEEGIVMELVFNIVD
ncbi:Zinc finger fyve domain-containing protein 9 [Plakobranchus ocellatus]|uniref:Zinc finger fyve domain-containing protein 9 n=1 Tax=Plakobranchus ocellatus TaxID=259542 RepID=A0AAV4CZ28_9GAST|nr:Zinc finger fyve domain-containing protein 9 [Plakobranchus ocellatus]